MMWNSIKLAKKKHDKICDARKRNLPGSFFVLNEALVIMDLETVTVVVDGVKATEMPIGPSLG